jgi:integrase
MKQKTTLQKPLTDADITRVKLGDEVQDRKQPMLRLRVSPKGKRVWLFYGHNPVTKKPLKQVLGNAEAMTVKAARDAVDAMKVETKKQIAPVPGAVPTFNDILETYAKPWVVTWIDRYCHDWRNKRLDAITQEMVESRERYILKDAGERQKLRDENGGSDPRTNAGATSVSVTGKALRTVYKLAAKKRGYLGENMGEHMTYTPAKPRKRVFTQAEEKRFFEALESDALSPWVKDFFTLLYWTGVRWGNLAKARWSDIDFDAARWIIEGRESKNGDEYRVQLTDEAIAILKGMQEKRVDSNPWLFPGAKDRSKHLTDITWPWKLIKKLGDLQGLTPHDVRRSYGSKMASSNVSLLVIKTLMNHKSIRTTETYYAHVSEEAQREALRALSRA